MTDWPEIACQRGHNSHASLTVDVKLGGPTQYHDYTSIPERFSRAFKMKVYDWLRYMSDGPYCPGNDVISETIVTHRVWEPRETALALQVFSTARPDQLVVDMGSQLGWFSLLAASFGLEVRAFDADQANVLMLLGSARLNDWEKLIAVQHKRITPESRVLRTTKSIRLAKLDLEGAERDGLRILWPAIEAGRVDHLLVEISPVFAGFYGRLVADLIQAGYECYELPPKVQPPVDLTDPADEMWRWRLDTRMDAGELQGYVAALHQEDFWFKRGGVEW